MNKIRELLALNKTDGAIGLEIEMEGQDLPKGEVLGKYWRYDRDGSLWGESVEYVMHAPKELKGVSLALKHLDRALKSNGAVVHDSVRAGVHCHVNVQELTTTQLISFATAYYILEEVLVDYCGPHRVGNHFCLRAKDAEGVLNYLRAAIERRNLRYLDTDDIRYAALNFKSLFRYGSLEFRAMTTTRDLNRIKMWAETLLHIKEAAIKYHDPTDIIASMSAEGPLSLAKEFLGPHAEIFLSTPEAENKLYSGVRLAQEIAYAGDWDNTGENNNVFRGEDIF